ncbi:uncharacterized protein [Haliotis asinina]|uniref:uncharacterized protein n=1 Tax=Haliotis asinina TaxID=109174 RepID=UPI003531D316
MMTSCQDRFSSWTKLKRIVAWILLAKEILLKKVQRKFKLESKTESEESDAPASLTVEMLQNAENAVIGYIQRAHYSTELDMFRTGTQPVKKSSPLYRLDPILAKGLIRVAGRLQRAEISYESKHPVLIPKESPVARLILMDIHNSVGHLGKNSMLCALREKYWIPGAETLIKQFVSKCVVCRKYKAAQMGQKMADLPMDRPNEPPLSRTDMDYFGPQYVKRGRGEVKRYGVIFTCMALRAVHLDVASSDNRFLCILSASIHCQEGQA